MKVTLLILTIFSLTGCSNASDAEKALTSAGYTQIQTHGYSLMGCSEDDFFATKFTAKNPVGNQTKGTVCSGLFFKGSTIRH